MANSRVNETLIDGSQTWLDVLADKKLFTTRENYDHINKIVTQNNSGGHYATWICCMKYFEPVIFGGIFCWYGQIIK